MESNNALKAKTLALAIAIGVGGPASAVRADELQDLKAQIEALRKKVGEGHREEAGGGRSGKCRHRRGHQGLVQTARVEYVGYVRRVRQARCGLQQSTHRRGD